MKRYFLFLDKKIELSDFAKDKKGKYRINEQEDIFMPNCNILYEDILADNHYEYTLGSYNEYNIWETFLSFTSDKKLIIEEN